jgi:hypothetical protein
LDIPYAFAQALYLAAEEMTKHTHEAFRLARRRSSTGAGVTLRPGKQTPLWNELRAQLRPHLRQRGNQAKLGRLLGLPRQRINSFIKSGEQMPDAERTLQLLVWLMAVKKEQPPA